MAAKKKVQVRATRMAYHNKRRVRAGDVLDWEGKLADWMEPVSKPDRTPKKVAPTEGDPATIKEAMDNLKAPVAEQ